jgi:solute carrier family 25 oxoglutarate transporter 11|uniref:Mitochondrial carrier protein n=1 Tax=viral metagenome TaxID=1070528 RepID=A0A6C0BPV2_9ZZZZ
MNKKSNVNQIPMYLTSSICASFITHPLDVIKVKLQTNKQYKHPIRIIQSQFYNKGPSFLFKGLKASVLRNGTFVTTKMFTYDYLKNEYNISSFPGKFICGMTAGLVGSFIGTPFDLIMVRIQNKPDIYPNILSTVKNTYNNEGILSFWNGVQYTMTRAVIVTACQFSIYEQMKQELSDFGIFNSRCVFMMSSIGSSITTGLLSNPLDLCKTRNMNNIKNSSISNIIRNEGVFSLWKGIYANIGRQIPLNLIRFSFLEYFKTYL